MKTRLGKIMIGTAIGAGALGVGFGASMAIASAATTHTSSATYVVVGGEHDGGQRRVAKQRSHSVSLTVRDA